MALQALAEFAALTSGDGSLSMNVNIKAGDLNHDFDTITQTNAIVLQSIEVVLVIVCVGSRH